MADVDSFPRQKARTRSFQLGRPRTFTVAGRRLFFIRSSGGTDPFGRLWLLNVDELEVPGSAAQCLVDEAALAAARGSATTTGVPEAELARRERMREVSAGVTAFDVDRSGAHVALVVDGVLYTVDTRNPSAPIVRMLPTPGPVVDPRIAPTGQRVAYVIDSELWCSGLDGSAPVRVCARTHEDQTWGLADFIAAEELDRHRGHWWLPDGRTLLVEEVDERPVDTWWIDDPSRPAAPPRPHRYPAAGTPNAAVALWLVDTDDPQRSAIPVAWDHEAFEYLASVQVDESTAVVELLSRDQRTGLISRLDMTADGAALEPVLIRTDPCWLDVFPGVPARAAAGATRAGIITMEVDAESDTVRLRAADEWLSPAHLQVTALLSADEHGLVFLANPNPMEQHCYRLVGGELHRLDQLDQLDQVSADDEAATTTSPHPTWTTAMCRDGIVVLASSSLASCLPDVQVRVLGTQVRAPIENLSEVPRVAVRPRLSRVGSRQIATSLLLPTDHDGGLLPVICSPYAGPHAQRVVSAAGAYATDQWMADQGFAVIVADGRGTPGRGPAWERAISDDWAAAVVADQVDALHSLAEAHPELDLTRVGIRGWSFGGYLAALAVLDRPDVFHAAVAGAPVTEWRLYDTAYTERYLGDPSTNAARYDAASLLPRAPALQRPLLMIHGMADDNVHVANTLQLSNALLAAGRAHSVLPLSGVTHMTPQEHVAENLLRVEIEFFRQYLNAPASSTR